MSNTFAIRPFTAETLYLSYERHYLSLKEEGHHFLSYVHEKRETQSCLKNSGCKRSDAMGVTIAISSLVFGFFVGLFFTVRSIKEAIQDANQLKVAKQNYKKLFQKEGNYYATLLSDESVSDRTTLEKACLIREGMKKERIMASMSQGLMTAGIGVLTFALVISFFSRFQFVMIKNIAIIGGGVFGGGFLLFGVKKCVFPLNKHQTAFNDLNKDIS